MKPATIKTLSDELKNLNSEELVRVCLRLAKFKKENKELLTYLLQQAENEESYREELKNEITEQFASINTSNLYYAKKGLRKVLRYTDRFIKYSGNLETEVEVRMHYCKELKQSTIQIDRSVLISNLYQRQLDKINKKIHELHDDLQYDYMQLMEENDLI